MEVWIIIYILRIISIILMYLGLFNGSICTLFILREFYYDCRLHTSLNFLIITIFTTDCIRALICAPFESFVLIYSWNITLNYCQEEINTIKSYLIILNICRLTMSIRSFFNVMQPFGFVAIAYERLRTIVQRNGNLNLNNIHQQRECIRLKYIIIWIILNLLLGISAGLYQGITYSPSNTCYNYSNRSSDIAMIIRIFSILTAALISGIIYGKIFFIVKNTVIPIINTIKNSTTRQKNRFIDMRKKDFRLAKNTFILFLSFFLCRIPLVIIIFVSLIINQQSNITRCYLEELTNFAFQLTFLGTITDPIAYIYTQPVLKQKFIRFITFCCKNRNQNPIGH
jgi:hypothetical protein